MALLYDKFASIGGKNMNVYSYENFLQNKGILIDDDQTAVEIVRNGVSTILPIRPLNGGVNIDKPGLYCNEGPISFLSFPTTKEEKNKYCPPADAVFNVSSVTDMASYMNQKEKYDSINNQILETPSDGGNVYKPPLLESDSAEMRALKECIIAKHIDIDKYSERFGENYPNDKRKLKDKDITSLLLKRMCNNLDIEVDLVFRDAKDKIPNPMNKVISVNFVPGNGNNVNITDK